jgi:RNA polymerase sigma-70 factor, ECF subfamily
MADAEPFETFVRRYQDMVFATAVRLLGDPTEAEDVAQAVFLKAFQRFAQIGQSPAAAGWLKTVTRNACLNHLSRYRARWRFFTEMDHADDITFEAGLVSGSSSPETQFDSQLQEAQLEHAIQQLPVHQRVPLVLYHFDGLSYEEIADSLSISLGKVKTDIHRGRQALKRSIRTFTPKSTGHA